MTATTDPKPTKRMLVTLPIATAERVASFAAKNSTDLSTAMRWLITQGLEIAAGRLEIGETPARPFCGCDVHNTCAKAFGRDFDGQCRVDAFGINTKAGKP